MRRALSTAAAILVCASLATACSRGGSDASGGDSAPQITLTELFRIGDEAAGDTVLFSYVEGMAVNSAGHIFVGDRQARSVFVFSDNGDFAGAIGGAGQGPGEFMNVSGVAVGPGDTLHVFDGEQARISLFEPSGHSFVNRLHLPAIDFTWPESLLAAVEEGFLVSYSMPFFMARIMGLDDIDTAFVTVHLVDRSGEIIQTVTRQSAAEFVVREGGSTMTIAILPFGRSPFFQVGPGGSVYSGWNQSIDIRIHSVDGTVEDSILYEHDPVPVTASDIEARFEDSNRETILGHGLPEFKPAYTAFAVDDRERVWIKLSRAHGATASDWLVLRPDGSVAATASLPSDVDLHVIDSNRAYGMSEDASGASMVVAYSVDSEPKSNK